MIIIVHQGSLTINCFFRGKNSHGNPCYIYIYICNRYIYIYIYIPFSEPFRRLALAPSQALELSDALRRRRIGHQSTPACRGSHSGALPGDFSTRGCGYVGGQVHGSIWIHGSLQLPSDHTAVVWMTYSSFDEFPMI